MCERVGDWQIRPRTVNTIGWVYAEVENHEEALDWNRKGVELAGSIPGLPDIEIEMNARLNLGDNLTALGRPEDAQEQYEIVEAVVRNPSPGQDWLLWRYSLHLFSSYSEWWLGRGDPTAALRYAEECLALAQETSSRKYVVKGRRLRSQALTAQGRLDEAAAALSDAIELAIEVGNPPQLWRTYAALADLRRRQGRPDDAKTAYDAALATIDAVAESLEDEQLRRRFLGSKHVQDIRRAADGTV